MQPGAGATFVSGNIFLFIDIKRILTSFMSSVIKKEKYNR
jgi:hypothetical protein